MTDKATDIANLLAPTVEALGLELLGVEYLPAPGSAVLRLYIDRPGADASAEGQGVGIESIGIEDCEAVSREVSAQLDVEDPISGNYTLEVSSPGVDRLLFTPGQFAQFVGERAKVGLKLPQDGRRKLTGTIVAVAAADGRDTITFQVDGQPFTVAFDNIDKARLMPDWAALGLAPARDADGDRRPGKQKKPSGRDARSDKQGNHTPTDKQTRDAAAAKPPRVD
ncbi:MAG: ribosome maturation factor RimP [Luteimonas sp.]